MIPVNTKVATAMGFDKKGLLYVVNPVQFKTGNCFGFLMKEFALCCDPCSIVTKLATAMGF